MEANKQKENRCSEMNISPMLNEAKAKKQTRFVSGDDVEDKINDLSYSEEVEDSASMYITERKEL